MCPKLVSAPYVAHISQTSASAAVRMASNRPKVMFVTILVETKIVGEPSYIMTHILLIVTFFRLPEFFFSSQVSRTFIQTQFEPLLPDCMLGEAIRDVMYQ